MINIYENIGNFIQQYPYVLIIFSLWELVWKALALWRASRNNQRYWFTALLIINTVGILPIVYLKFFQKKK